MATEQELTVMQSEDSQATDGRELVRPRKLLRAVNADVYDLFIERLEEQRIHSYDVQLVVEESEACPNDGLILKVLYGDSYSNVFEKPVSRAGLEVGSPEMETFLAELIAACEESLILDYRKFMQPHT